MQIWAQLDHMSPSFDLFNYAEKLTGTTKFDLYQSYQLGLKYGLLDRLSLSYNVQLTDQNVTRTQEPKQINSRFFGHELRLQYVFYRADQLQWAIDAGFKSHRARALDFFRFDTTVGGTPISAVALGNEPVFSLTASDSTWFSALRGAIPFGRHLRMDFGIEARRTTVRANLNSSLLSDPIIGPALLNQAPQATPWHENHLLLQWGMSWSPLRSLSLAADYTFHAISRNGYVRKAGKTDYNSNHQLDGYIFWHVSKTFTVYGHGRASQRFILGDMPLVYNTRTNHRFKNPFGFVSIGTSMQF